MQISQSDTDTSPPPLKRERSRDTSSGSCGSHAGSDYSTDSPVKRERSLPLRPEDSGPTMVPFQWESSLEEDEPNPFLVRPSPHYLTAARDLSYVESRGPFTPLELIPSQPQSPTVTPSGEQPPVRHREHREAPYYNSDGSLVLVGDSSSDVTSGRDDNIVHGGHAGGFVSDGLRGGHACGVVSDGLRGGGALRLRATGRLVSGRCERTK